MRLKLIACEMVFREVCWAAAQAQYPVDLEFLPQTNHDDPALGREHLQARIDGVGRIDAVLVGYGLCHGLVVGVRARYQPLVIPRAQDCLSLSLGSNQRRRELVQRYPQALFHTAGWLENRGGGCTAEAIPEALRPDDLPEATRVPRIWIDFPFTHHLKGAPSNLPRSPEQETWETVPGDGGWLQRWVDGEWEGPDFLIVQPGERIYATGDERIIAAR